MMMIILRAAEVEEGGEKDVCIKKRKKEEEGEGERKKIDAEDQMGIKYTRKQPTFFFYLLRRR